MFERAKSKTTDANYNLSNRVNANDKLLVFNVRLIHFNLGEGLNIKISMNLK